MKESQVEVADYVPAISNRKVAAFDEATDGRGFDLLRFGQGQEFVHVARRDRQHHSLLRFADPDFVVSQPGILKRHLLQIDLGAEAFGHFTNCGGKPAGAAVGD